MNLKLDWNELDAATKEGINILATATEGMNLKREMGKLGFKEPRHGGYSSKGFGVIWVGENFVIKNPHIHESKKNKPRQRVPDMRLGKLLGVTGWMVQPRCEPITKTEYRKIMSDGTFSKKSQDAFDLNDCNVGKYKGKYLAFDW